LDEILDLLSNSEINSLLNNGVYISTNFEKLKTTKLTYYLTDFITFYPN